MFLRNESVTLVSGEISALYTFWDTWRKDEVMPHCDIANYKT